MRKVVGMTVILGSLLGGMATNVLADVRHFTGPNGESCTRTTDENDNVSTMCGSPRRQPSVTNEDDDNFAPRSDRGRMPKSSFSDRRSDLAAVIVGKWRYNVSINGNIVEATAAFSPDHTYVLALRFPNTPRLGQQVAVEAGDYAVEGDTLSTNPSEIKVLRGPRPDQLCDLQARRCTQMPLTPTQVELQALDRNTLQGSIGNNDFTAKRLPNQQTDDSDQDGGR
jgi:hypothetical protein